MLGKQVTERVRANESVFLSHSDIFVELRFVCEKAFGRRRTEKGEEKIYICMRIGKIQNVFHVMSRNAKDVIHACVCASKDMKNW